MERKRERASSQNDDARFPFWDVFFSVLCSDDAAADDDGAAAAAAAAAADDDDDDDDVDDVDVVVDYDDSAAADRLLCWMHVSFFLGFFESTMLCRARVGTVYVM